MCMCMHVYMHMHMHMHNPPYPAICECPPRYLPLPPTLLSVPKPRRSTACSLRGGRGGSKTGHVAALSTPSGSEQMTISAWEMPRGGGDTRGAGGAGGAGRLRGGYGEAG